jgi:protein-S-isoprenylcysteine O-methyltransferase Ste14
VADQATGTVETRGGTAAAVGQAHGMQHLEHNSGRPISWIGVSIVLVGFIFGAVGFVPHMRWWEFWAGAAIALVGIIIIAAARTMSKDWY